MNASNARINWLVALILFGGIPLYIAVWKSYFWALIAIKVYLYSAIVFAAICLISFRLMLGKIRFWIGILPLVLIHTGLMFALVKVNMAFPGIDQFPVATYGALAPLAAMEAALYNIFLRRFLAGDASANTRIEMD